MGGDAEGPGQRLAATLRAARERKKWTQEDLADAANVSRQTVIRYESGKAANPEAEPLRRVCEAAELDVREVLVDLGYVTRDELALPPRPRRLDRALVEPDSLLNDPNIPDAAKDRLREYIEESVIFWKRRAGFLDLREPSAEERAKGKSISPRR